MKEAAVQEAITKLTTAVDIEDSFAYMEPPRVYQPVRQCLGYVLLEDRQYQEAEEVLAPFCSTPAPCIMTVVQRALAHVARSAGVSQGPQHLPEQRLVPAWLIRRSALPG